MFKKPLNFSFRRDEKKEYFRCNKKRKFLEVVYHSTTEPDSSLSDYFFRILIIIISF